MSLSGVAFGARGPFVPAFDAGAAGVGAALGGSSGVAAGVAAAPGFAVRSLARRVRRDDRQPAVGSA